MTRHNGFTLVEMLVALAIFALISVAGVTLLQTTSTAQIAVKTRLSILAERHRASALIERDLAQAIDRPVRNDGGATVPAFATGVGNSTASDALFGFTRIGWSNLDNSPRPDIQRVSYVFSDNTLRRIALNMPDAGQPETTIIFDNVAGVTAQFRGSDGAWRDTWDGANPSPLPRAVALNIQPKKGARLRMLFLVAGGDATARPQTPQDKAGAANDSAADGANDAPQP